MTGFPMTCIRMTGLRMTGLASLRVPVRSAARAG